MIVDKKVSYFKSTREICVESSYSIGEALDLIKDGTYRHQVEEVRAGDEEVKKLLPTIAFHGLFKRLRKKNDFYEASGIIIIDIDDVPTEDIEGMKSEIMEGSEHILAVMKSVSGNGIKVLYYITPELVEADNYRQIGKQVSSDFSIYGKVDYLSVTDCLIMTYDPTMLVNREVVPSFVHIKESQRAKVELEKLDKSVPLWDDAEEFFDTVLFESIKEKTTNNFHFIQVSMLDLAKFGFTHPAHDLSFVIDYAPFISRVPSDNKKRFLDIVKVANTYPQLKHPYKMVRKEADEYKEIEYGQSHTTQEEDKYRDEYEEYGLIDYHNLYDRVLGVMKEGSRVGREVSFVNFANAFRFKGTGILTITGIPSHGKTEFTDALCLDLARLYGEGTIVVGFEQSSEEHIIKIIRKIVGADITCPSWLANKDNVSILQQAYDFVIRHFTHIDTLRIGGGLTKILESVALLIASQRSEGRNPRYLVLDPFNMLSLKGSATGHEKIEEMLRIMKHFSHQMDIMVIVIAHPFKMRKDEKTGEYIVPDFYSVKGTSAFFEMSYHGLVVYKSEDRVLVRVLKVKQNNMGTIGADVYFEYEREPGRYIPIDEAGNELKGDHRKKNWLT